MNENQNTNPQPTAEERAVNEYRRRQFLENRASVFRRICPPLYLNTDPKRLAPPADAVLELPYPKDGKGVLLVGPTRTGKTRTAWALAAKWFFLHDWSMMAYNGGEFGRAVAKNYGDGSADEWHKDLRDAPILLLDDLFKHRMTDAVQDAVFSVIEDRMAYLKPTIMTLNNDGGGVNTAVSADMATPLIERLRESFNLFRFVELPKAPPKPDPTPATTE